MEMKMSDKKRSHKAEKVIERMGKKLNRQIVGSLVGCVHCGMCTETCHYVLANPGDPTYAPAYKADQIRKALNGISTGRDVSFPGG
jgi:succinate dehydrogenase/fumarate reductase-like Fe-S protein